MESVDRAHFVTDTGKSAAYTDSPQAIGHGATISAPHMHAYAIDHLLPFLRPGAKVLDIGSGSGYLCAVLHRLVSSYAEDQPEKVAIRESEGPFDCIHVGAASPTIPEPLISQLARPGRMFIPVGTLSQHIFQVDKDAEGNVTKTQIMAVNYVPLTDKDKQRPW
ncbi:protein-L-isoaspartate O-methyltransferase [Mycena leptocephala]|nr:protein-L-isoaspartate O-methyltransferase [Mycena leptocephala]